MVTMTELTPHKFTAVASMLGPTQLYDVKVAAVVSALPHSSVSTPDTKTVP